MKVRIITAIVALALFIPAILVGGIVLQIIISLLAIIAMSEIIRMRKIILVSFGSLLALIGTLIISLPIDIINKLPINISHAKLLYIFIILMLLHTVLAKNSFNFEDAGVFTLSMFYIGLGFKFFIDTRNTGLDVLFYMLLIVWITDSAAYLVGRKFGKHKLTKISPKKTWEGSIGGTLIATIIVSIYLIFYPMKYNWGIMVIITIILSMAGQYGDLVESALKRFYKIKDSGNIFPGHGGVLDRFDSMLLVLPIMYILGIIK